MTTTRSGRRRSGTRRSCVRFGRSATGCGAAIALGVELTDHEAERTENIIAEMNIHGGDLREIDKNDRTQKTVLRRDRPKEIQKMVFEFLK